MPELRIQKLERFAQALAAGASAKEAAQQAKYPKGKGSSFADNARKRARYPSVKARVAELRAPALAIVQADVTASIEWAVNKLYRIADVELGDDAIKTPDQIRAIEVLGKFKSWMAPERHELTGKDGKPVSIERIERTIVDPANPDRTSIPAAP